MSTSAYGAFQTPVVSCEALVTGQMTLAPAVCMEHIVAAVAADCRVTVALAAVRPVAVQTAAVACSGGLGQLKPPQVEGVAEGP